MSPQATAVETTITSVNDLGQTIVSAITVGATTTDPTTTGRGSGSTSTTSLQSTPISKVDSTTSPISNTSSTRNSTTKTSSTQPTHSSPAGTPTGQARGNSNSGGGLKTGAAIGIGIAIAVFAIGVCCVIGFICHRRRVRRKAIQSRHGGVNQRSGPDMAEMDITQAGTEKPHVAGQDLYELSGKSRPGELETKANRHEMNAELDRGTPELKSIPRTSYRHCETADLREGRRDLLKAHNKLADLEALINCRTKMEEVVRSQDRKA